MGIFRRGPERELQKLVERRKAIAERLAAAERRLIEEQGRARTVLLEHDLDASGQPPKFAVAQLRSEVETLHDVLGEIDGRIAEAEATLVQERDRAARDQERQRRQEALDRARAVRDRFTEVSRDLIEALKGLASIGHDTAHAANVTQFLTGQLALAHEAGFAEAARYIAQVTNGNVPIRIEPAKIEPLKPLPRIERRSMLLLQASRWPDPEEPSPGIRTSGKMTTVQLPLAVAEAAERYGFALEPFGPLAMRHREVEGVDNAYNAPSGCIDITKPRPVPKLPDGGQTVTSPVIHSSLAGARVGVANAVPVVR
jgi:hypothetical protein